MSSERSGRVSSFSLDHVMPAGVAVAAQPRVLEVRSATGERVQAAQEADLVGVRRRVEVAAQQLRRARVGAARADRVIDCGDLTLARDAVVEPVVEVRGVDPDRAAVGRDARR